MTNSGLTGETLSEENADLESRCAREQVRNALFGQRERLAVGRFELQHIVGRGGMGVVYAAHDPVLDRQVALKLVHVDRREQGQVGKARLLREAWALAKLSHPNVVPVYEIIEYEGDVAIVMELVEGQDLSEWTACQPDWPEVLRVLVGSGRGLAAAHEAGLVHRDFKPRNVLVGKDGRARVTDFGLVRGTVAQPVADTLEDRELGSAHPVALTQTGYASGTPAYMAPESWEGKHVDARADQFAFGATAYEALCGEPAFRGDSVAALKQAILSGRMPSWPGQSAVPRRARRAIVRSMATDPADRFADMSGLLAELEAALRPWGRPVVLVGVGALGAGVLAWFSTGSPPCQGSESALADVWSTERADALRRAYEDSETPSAAEAWTRIGPALRTHAELWIAEHQDACRAARVDERQTERDLDLRMSCLETARRTFGALVDQLETADAGATENAVTAVAQLVAPRSCRDIERLRADPIEAPPPMHAQAIEEMRRRLDTADAMAELGRGADARPQVHRLLAEAQDVGYAPLLASLYHTVGKVSAAEDELEPKRAAHRRAFDLALDARDDRVAVLAALALARHYVYDARDDAKAELWLTQAETIVRRERLEGDLLCRLHARRTSFHRRRRELELMRERVGRLEESCAPDKVGRVAHALSLAERAAAAGRDGAPEDAEVLSRRARTLVEDVFGRQHPRFAKASRTLAAVLFDRGQYVEAREILSETRALYVELFGPQHTLVAEVDVSLASFDYKTGNPEHALELLESARGILAQRGDSEEFERLLGELVTVHEQLGNYDEARRRGAQLLELVAAARGPDDPGLIGVLITLVNAEAKDGRWDAALTLLTRAEHIIEASVGSTHYYMGIALQLRAQIEASQGELEVALTSIDEGVRILLGAGRPPIDIARVRMARASVLSQLSRNIEAKAEAELARALSVEAGPEFESFALRIDAFISGLPAG